MGTRVGLRQVVWFLTQYLLLGWLLPGVLAVGLGERFATPPVVLLIVLQLSAAALAANGTIGLRHVRLMDIGFWSYVYIFFGVAGTLQRMASRFPWSAPPLPLSDHLRAEVVVLVGVLAYAGARLVMGRVSVRAVRAHVRPGRLALVGTVAAGVSMAAFFALYGVRAVIVDRLSRSDVALSVAGDLSGALVLNSLLAAPIRVLLAATLLALAFDRRHRRALVASTLLLVFANLAINNFVNSPRFSAGTVFLAAVAAYLLGSYRRRRLLRLVPVALVLGMIVLFPFADRFRAANRSLESRPVVELLQVKGDFDSYLQVVNAVRYVDAEGSQAGRNLLGALGFWIPRRIWSDKPRPTGEVLASHEGYPYQNLSAPLWAEGFVAFGWAGVVLLLSLWGAIAGRLDRAIRSAVIGAGGPLQADVVAGVLLFGYSLFFLRGALMPALAYLVPMLLVIPLAVRWILYRSDTVSGRSASTSGASEAMSG